MPASDLTIDLKPTSEPLAAAERDVRIADPGFGRVFTEHMVTIRWTEGRGWHDAVLRPYGPLELDPATSAFHYGQEIFEGLKAYRLADGSIASFRPEANARRMARSARRMAMPELPEDLFVAAIDALVRQDQDWVPSGPDQSLYLRPLMFATETSLGVNRPSSEFLFLVLASPVGAYFANGISPVRVWATDQYVRAVEGGTGEAKCAGNYAASFAAQARAVQEGCDQVVWLDPMEHRWVEEMGSNNLVFVYGFGDSVRLLTPELSGSLLPGITRDSLLTLSKDLGLPIEEGRISIEEWRDGCADGSITEVFGCGTAAVITPVGSIKWRDDDWTVGDGTPGPVTMRLRQALCDIQTGQAPDVHGWRHPIVP